MISGISMQEWSTGCCDIRFCFPCHVFPVILPRPKNCKIHDEVVLKFQDSHIHLVSTVKCLGVLFKELMSWDPHVEATAAKLASVAGILCKVGYSLPKTVKLIIYNSLFLSVLSYCYLAWGTTTASNMRKLHIIKQKAIQAIANTLHDSPSEPLFRELHLVSLRNIYEHILMKCYESEVRKKFQSLRSIACLSLNVHTRDTRFWEVPHCRTTYGEQRLCIQLPRLLNKQVL